MMAALLAGARLVLRQGLRLLPHVVRPAAVPVRCLGSSTRFFKAAVQDKGLIDLEPVKFIDSDDMRLMADGWSLHHIGIELKKTKRISKERFLKISEVVCSADKPSSSQVWFLLQMCGSLMPAVPLEERTELVDTIWNKLQELGVVFNEIHYNTLLKTYLENGHKFSPTEFLAHMEAAQLQPNQTTYEGLIAAYCNEGDIHGASKILGFMKSTNLPLTADVFSSLIKGHARSGDMESAKNILSVMQGAGLAPIKETYGALLCAYAEKGDIENIKQIIDDCSEALTTKMYLKLIYSLAKAGHSQFVPDIFKYMPSCIGYIQDVINLCLMLMTQGCADTALQVAKRCMPIEHSFFRHQSGSFFIRHCVYLNTPLNILKKYAAEMEESKLHLSPLQFALDCALEYNKKDMALELIRALKEDGLPVKPHYYWPLLASYRNEQNIQGSFEVLKMMHTMNVNPDFDTYRLYVDELFENAEFRDSIKQDSEFQKDFKKRYHSALKDEFFRKNFKSVYNFLSESKIPFDPDKHFLRYVMQSFAKHLDVQYTAKMTKLLCHDASSLQKPSSETVSVGYFLYGLIDNMSETELQAREEYLRQYFLELKEMGLVVVAKKAEAIISLLKTRNVPLLIEDFKKLVSSDENVDGVEGDDITEMEKQLEIRKANDLPFDNILIRLMKVLIEQQDLEKILVLKSMYGSYLGFPMYMKILGLCCLKNNPKEALKVKYEVDQRDFSGVASSSKYMSLFEVLAKNGLLEDAINILKEMQERNVNVNEFITQSFGVILNHLAMKDDVDAVNLLHEHIVMLGLAKPTAHLCIPLVKVHLNRNNLSAALDTMIACNEKYKCLPQQHELMLKLVNSGETDLLKKAVDYISKKKGERVVFHDLLFVFIELEKYEEAQKIAETPGLRAIPIKMNWFVNRIHNMNKVEAMEKLLEITGALYNCNREDLYFKLLNQYGTKNEWDKATALWHKMKEEGVTLQNETSTLSNIFGKNGQDNSAHIPEFIQVTGHADRTAKLTRNKRLVELCTMKSVHEAYSLFLETMENSERPSKTAYTRLIKLLLESQMLEEALKVEEVTKSHFSDYSMQRDSYNLLLAEQVRRDCLKDALVNLEKMLGNGMMPSRFVINRLNNSFAMHGDVESLEKMEEIVASSRLNISKLNHEFFNNKLLAHFINGNFEEATSIIESSCTENPNSSISYLLSSLMNNNMSEAVEKVGIVADRLSNLFSINLPITEMFISYVRTENVEEAKQLLQRGTSILEQKKMLRCIVKNIKNQQNEFVYRLLDIVDDPFYKRFGYDGMMKHYLKAQTLDDAVALYDRMKAEEIELSESCLKQLADLLRKQDKPVPFPEPQESLYTSSNEEQSYTSSQPEDITSRQPEEITSSQPVH